MKYSTNFIINNEKLTVTLNDRKWLLRQPTIEENLSGIDAYQLGYDHVIKDERLKSIAGNEDNLIIQARKRGLVSRSIYMLPLLLQDKNGEQLYNVYDKVSLNEFEQFCGNNPDVLEVWTLGFFDLMSMSDNDVKKKPQ